MTPFPRRRATVELRIDRDSVAAGDDVVSHARSDSVAHGTSLSDAIAHASPEIRAAGWSWVAVVDRTVAAVWSVDHGVRMLVPDRELVDGPVSIHFRYFTQIDPEWLFARLADGARPDRYALAREYAPIAQEKYRADLCRREREIPTRLLSTECITALAALGAEVTLHADIACDLTIGDERWAVRRADTMLQVFVDGSLVASIRPHDLGEAWIVGMRGAAMRLAEGRPELPDAEPLPGLDLVRSGRRWTSHGATVVQVDTERGARVARFVCGRSLAEVRRMLES